MFLLKQNIISIKQVDKIVKQLELKNGGKKKKHKVENIQNSMIYSKKLEVGYFLGLYDFVS